MLVRTSRKIGVLCRNDTHDKHVFITSTPPPRHLRLVCEDVFPLQTHIARPTPPPKHPPSLRARAVASDIPYPHIPQRRLIALQNELADVKLFPCSHARSVRRACVINNSNSLHAPSSPTLFGIFTYIFAVYLCRIKLRTESIDVMLRWVAILVQ